MKTPKQIRWALIKILKASKRQFYDEEGKPCSVEVFADLCLKQPLSAAKEYQKKVQEKKDMAKNEPKKQ